MSQGKPPTRRHWQLSFPEVTYLLIHLGVSHGRAHLALVAAFLQHVLGHAAPPHRASRTPFSTLVSLAARVYMQPVLRIAAPFLN